LQGRQILGEALQHFQDRVTVPRNTSRHITGSDAAMRVKSRKPEAEKLITSDFSVSSRSVAVPTIV